MTVLDHVLRIDGWVEAGHEYALSDRIERPGGAGLNVATYASFSCGIDTDLLSYVGADDAGRVLRRFLERHGVGTDHVIETPGRTPEIFALLGDNDARAYLFDISGVDFRFSLEQINFDEYPIVYISPIPEIDDVVFLSEMAHGCGSLVIFNPGTSFLEIKYVDMKDACRNVDIIILNEKEAKTYTNEESIQSALTKLETWAKRYVVVTLGGEGVVARSVKGTACWQLRGLDVAVNREVGLGDAFGAGLACNLSRGKPLKECLAAGIAMSALAAQYGSSIPPHESFKARLEESIERL